MTATWHRVPPPLEDDEPDNAPWEPWSPRVGDRVVVRLSGECQGADLATGRRFSHARQCDGETAVVVHITPWVSHSFEVQMDRMADWISDGTLYRAFAAYAAIELELISDSEPAADERRRAG